MMISALRRFALITIMLATGLAHAQAPEATIEDYQDLVFDYSKASREKIIVAYQAIDKILNDQLTLSEIYKQEIGTPHGKIFQGQINPGGPFGKFTFVDNKMQDVYVGKNGMQTNNWTILSKEFFNVMFLFKNENEQVAAEGKAQLLRLIKKYDGRLTQKIREIEAIKGRNNYADKLSIDGLLDGFLYMLAFDYSLSGRPHDSIKSLDLLRDIKKLKLSDQTKSIIQLGLKNSLESGGYMLFENGKLVNRSKAEEIELRNANPVYKKLFKEVFGRQSGIGQCEALFGSL